MSKTLIQNTEHVEFKRQPRETLVTFLENEKLILRIHERNTAVGALDRYSASLATMRSPSEQVHLDSLESRSYLHLIGVGATPLQAINALLDKMQGRPLTRYSDPDWVRIEARVFYPCSAWFDNHDGTWKIVSNLEEPHDDHEI